MIMEMFAGDEIAPTDARILRATGYLARNWYRFNRHSWLQDTVDHTASAFLGITPNALAAMNTSMIRSSRKNIIAFGHSLSLMTFDSIESQDNRI